ncbi:hypothetical protein AAG906_029121 [Vitis piasezkii]
MGSSNAATLSRQCLMNMMSVHTLGQPKWFSMDVTKCSCLKRRLVGVHSTTVSSSFSYFFGRAFGNGYFMSFSMWGGVIVEITRRNRGFDAFLRVFNETCRIAIDEKLESIKPDLDTFNVALERCDQDLEFVSEGEKVVEMMSILGIHLDESSFGFLAYLYALKSLEEKIVELEGLMDGFSFQAKTSNVEAPNGSRKLVV